MEWEGGQFGPVFGQCAVGGDYRLVGGFWPRLGSFPSPTPNGDTPRPCRLCDAKYRAHASCRPRRWTGGELSGDQFTTREVGWMVSPWGAKEPRDCEVWMESKPNCGYDPRLRRDALKHRRPAHAWRHVVLDHTRMRRRGVRIEDRRGTSRPTRIAPTAIIPRRLKLNVYRGNPA